MTDTLAVVALDAADHALLERWDCENLLLDSHGGLETITGTREIPLTTEVWPTVATGLPPEEHGIVANGEQQTWESPLLETASIISSRLLPERARVTAGEVVRNLTGNEGTGMQLQQTTEPHPFPEDGVYGWPGLTDASHLLQAWRWLELANEDELSEREMLQNLYENTGQEVGWLVGLADRGFPVLGVHMHVLDVAGHLYADRESGLRRVYERVDELFGVIRAVFDHILILSDHGIQVSWLNDEDVGNHSLRAYAATAVDDDLPESVFDVRDWIRAHRGTESYDESSSEFATTEERLRDLGYIN